MIKNEKVLLCFIFFFIEAKCFHYPKTYSQYYKPFYSQLSNKNDQSQIPNKLDVASSVATYPEKPKEKQRYWPYHDQTTTTSTTTTEVPPWNIFMEREKTLQHMSNTIISYFMKMAVQDFVTKLGEALNKSNLYIDGNEDDIIKKQCEMCSYDELKNYLESLLIILEKYPPLSRNVTLSHHIATEYERACDFLYQKFKQFKYDIEELNTDEELLELKSQYFRKELHGGLMTMLLNWFEIYAQTGVDDEEDIQKKLIKHLQSLKRYWLINIKGVFVK